MALNARLGLTAAILLACAAPAAALAPPTDPQYAQQTALAVMRQPQALATIGTTPFSDITVGVLDTGLDLTNPEFASRLVTLPAGTVAPDTHNGTSHPVPAGNPGWDFIGGGPKTLPNDMNPTVAPDADPSDPTDGSGHGSFVSGLLGQAANNGIGGAGVATNARFLPLRTCWSDPPDYCFQDIQADAINFGADQGVRVFSASWLATKQDFIDNTQTALAAHPEVLFVTIPPGNHAPVDVAAEDDPDDRDPYGCNAPLDNVMCVSPSSPSDAPDCGDYNSTMVDVAIPTAPNIDTGNGPGFSTIGCSTSASASTAAGAAAFIFGLDPTASGADVKHALIDSERQVPGWAGKNVGNGVVDLDAAVKLFAQRRGITLHSDPNATGPTGPTGSTGTTGPTGGKDKTKPVLSIGLALSRLKARNGLSLRATLSEPASISVTIRRLLSGRRVAKHCVAATRKNRKKPKCTRVVTVRSLTITGLKVGPNRRVVTARDSKRKLLPPGSYEVTVVAKDPAGNRSSSRTSHFTILHP
jgi:hypothetical protein